jgi:putative flippase GtrA
MSRGARVALYAAFCALAIAANLSLQAIAARGLGLGYWPSLMVGTGGGLVFKYVLDRNYVFDARGAGAAKDVRRFVLYAGFGLFTTAVFWSTEWLGHRYLTGETGRYLGGGLGLCIGYALKYWMDKRWVFQPITGNP